MLKLSIIIVHYNQYNFLEKCLKSLERIQVEKEIIIVDNNSVNNYQYFNNIKNKYIIIFNSENLGYGKACNKGASIAKNEVLLFINPDIEYIEGDWEKLNNFLNNNNLGLIFPALFYPDGRFQHSCRTFYNMRILFFRKFFSKLWENLEIMKKHIYDDKLKDEIFEVDWGLGGAFFIKKEVFEKFLGFDKSYFLYFEDVDLAYRIKLENYKNYFFPFIKFIHSHQRSSKKIFSKSWFYHLQSMIIFIKKHGIKF